MGIDQDDETMAKANKINSKKNLNTVQDTYQDGGNLYSYHFVDQDDATMEKAKKINSKENLNSVKDTYQDGGNLYSYHGIDQDAETMAKAKKINSGSEYLSKEKQQATQRKSSQSPMKLNSQSTLSHILTKKDWNIWKQNMVSMKAQMKEHSELLALYMHCMLQ